MKAVVVERAGFPGDLRHLDVPEPRPARDGVLIRVEAAGVNYADYLVRLGAYVAAVRFPAIPGLEVAGTVEEVGAGVDRPRPGDRVVAWAEAGYAELAAVPAALTAPLPAGLSFVEAAAVPVAFGTAWYALRSLARLRPGERVLVHAAGSGVGSAAIVLAKHLGAWVLATAGQDWKLERARQLGADAVAPYADVAAEVGRLTGDRGVDVVLEGVGRTTFADSMRSLAPGGRIVVYGAPGGSRVDVELLDLIRHDLTLHGMWLTRAVRSPEFMASFRDGVLPLFADGRLAPVVDAVYPLREAAAAHDRLLERAQFGKLVLSVGESRD